ncbi:MAG: methylated-DNA--[protein]-cysteine S-methyltransferase [Peptostreptococcales bacterium]
MDKGFAIYETEFGLFQFEYEDGKIVGIEKADRDIMNKGLKTPLTDKAYQELTEYFKGKRKEFSFPYALKGTEFQKKVWQALCEIPYGETRTYKEIAIRIGNPKACRAVGLANNKNPIMIAVPCHRVIGSGGKLVGYGGGIDMKKNLLDLEKTNRFL